MTLLLIWIAFLMDLFIGDPYSWPHPVKAIGHYISAFQRTLVTDSQTKTMKYVLGTLLWGTTVFGTGVITWCLLVIGYKIHPILGHVLTVYLSYTTLATKSLAFEGKKVARTLENGSIEDARHQVGMIVGRDTSQLTKEEIATATIETIAENTSDGVIAPMLCLFIGGPILAMMYKAVNTLDSMVGYVTPTYKEIGCVSAIMDDNWNLIPARISYILIGLSSVCLQMNPKQAFKIGWRDHKKHKSPNGGYLEAVAAGALGIQLGGSHVYHGVEIYKPTIGDPLRQVDDTDIFKMNQLLYVASWLGMMLFTLIYSLFLYL